MSHGSAKNIMNTKGYRIGLGILVLALGTGVASIAAARGADGATPQCDGGGKQSKTPEERAQHAAERFKKADKNGDGFLTQDEVGAKRWEHMKVADANQDGKISAAELAQAHADGKLGHKHGNRPS